LKPYSIWHKGDVASQQTGRVIMHGGFSCDVSTREDDFRGQVADAIDFLKTNREDLLRLGLISEIERIFAFGISVQIVDEVWPFWFYRLPAELARRAGELNIDVQISIYPTCKSEDKPAG
jgi:hypothetical protein